MHSTRSSYVTYGLMAGVLILAARSHAGDAMDIGSRRQLFVDRTLIESLRDARLVLHRPIKREIAIKPEHPWERNGVSYMVTFTRISHLTPDVLA